MVMKKIFITGRYDLKDLICSVDNRPDLGWVIENDPSKADIFLNFDSLKTPQKLYDAKYVLIRSEPEIVLPECYRIRNLARFDTIIDVGKPDNINHSTIKHPQNLEIVFNNSDQREDRLVLINSNLFSLRKGELYSLRREIIFNYNVVDLYGYGWNKNIFSKLKVVLTEVKNLYVNPTKINLSKQISFFRKNLNQRGSVVNKKEILSKYKYALIIENSQTYLSEKLFDALTSSCIPIYVGADLNKFNIPNFLYMKAEPNLDSIIRAFQDSKDVDYNNWVEKSVAWLQSEEVKKEWSQDYFIDKIDKFL